MASLLPAVHGGAPILAMSGGGIAATTQAPTMSGGGIAATTQAPTMSGSGIAATTQAPTMSGSGIAATTQAPTMSGSGIAATTQAPTMSGGGMETLLPAAPPVHIAGMHGGAMSLLPLGDGDIRAMRGGGVSAASFGITDTFPKDADEVRKWKEDSLCRPITETKTELCPSLYPFVDRRVQALLQRVNLSTGPFDMGCGTIERKGSQLSISFDQRAITLLSSDFESTFAAFRRGMSPHQPDRAKGGGVGMAGLLQWMLGSPVIKDGPFHLVTFMKDMSQPLSIEGFRQFLSYHTDHVDDGMICKNAMKLYGYKIGALNPMEITGVYGWIFPPNMAARRVGNEFEVYSTTTDAVTKTTTFPSNKYGFTVYEYDSPNVPVIDPVGSSEAPVNAKPSAPPAKPSAPPAKPSAPPAKPSAPSATAATAVAKPPAAQVATAAVASKPSIPFSGRKNNTPITVPDQQMIGGQDYTLRGMIQHDGGTDGGHYTYLYHSPTTKGEWVQFSDNIMTYPTGDALRKNLDTGYIYLFEKPGVIDPRHKGMANHGNSCWMNAAIQMFYHIPEYYDYITKFDPSTSSLSETIKNITLAIQQIFLKYSVNDYKVMQCPTEYQTLFHATFPEKRINTQQDAMEFIDKVLLDIIEKVPAVRSLFEIQYESTITCKNPPMDPSVNTMHPTALRLPIPSTSSTLDQLLEDYSKPHPINYKVGTTPCPTATQTVTIQTTKTKYVILQLNRFENALSL